MKILYIADDGTQFKSESDCRDYEYVATLSGHISKNCPTTYCDDSGFSIIEESDVESYIRTHIEQIIELVKSR